MATSRAYIVDKMHVIGELLALSDHLEEKLRAEPEDNLKAMNDEALALRREMMASLMDDVGSLMDVDSPNPDFACAFKHAIKALTLQGEVYDTTHTDKDLQRLVKISDLLAMAISLYLGLEFTVCERCLADVFLTRQLLESRETDKIETKEIENGDKHTTN